MLDCSADSKVAEADKIPPTAVSVFVPPAV
jgi:hypothetical protein